MDREQLDELVQRERQSRGFLVDVKLIGHRLLKINKHSYQIIMDKYNTFSLKAFRYRYNTVFNKFDYLLGDWSYGQLRLSGFYDVRRRVPQYLKITHLQDYLAEDCNFGALYFLIKKLK